MANLTGPVVKNTIRMVRQREARGLSVGSDYVEELPLDLVVIPITVSDLHR